MASVLFCTPMNVASFKRKMDLASISSSDKIAVAVSGGADSMALCLLALGWKRSHDRNGAVRGLVGLTVDHGLRPESADEVLQVQRWLKVIGMECEILKCSWPQGVPSAGHVQECARKARYTLLQEACRRNNVRVLLTAHHADDQAELLVLRLSRCSGINGLACMALSTELYPDIPLTDCNSILLVRPLLEFSKDDLYDLCRRADQQWVEDPTNAKMVYARNRIRQELSTITDLTRSELLNLITMFREKRAQREAATDDILKKVVHIDTDHGYVVLNADGLLAEANDTATLENVVAAVLRFVSQRSNPPRGSSVRKTVAWLQNRSSESRFTIAGCSICLQRGSKGSQVIVTYSPDSPRPGSKSSRPQKQQASMQPIHPRVSAELENVLLEAIDRKIISDSTASYLSSLSQRVAEDMDSSISTYVYGGSSETSSEPDTILPGESTYFTQRFLISWNQQLPHRCKACLQGSCPLTSATVTRVRYFEKNDLSTIRELALSNNSDDEAWRTLKSLPEYVRRAIPVLETDTGVLVAVPSVNFQICKDAHIDEKFSPSVPLGGGHAIWS